MAYRWIAPVLAFTLAAAYPSAQDIAERIDAEVNARIRAEGMEQLPDHGDDAPPCGRVRTASHRFAQPRECRQVGHPTDDRVGTREARLEPFEFKTATVTPAGGWLNERASGHIISPMRDNLVFEVLAWTPSTAGTVTGPVVTAHHATRSGGTRSGWARRRHRHGSARPRRSSRPISRSWPRGQRARWCSSVRTRALPFQENASGQTSD